MCISMTSHCESRTLRACKLAKQQKPTGFANVILLFATIADLGGEFTRRGYSWPFVAIRGYS